MRLRSLFGTVLVIAAASSAGASLLDSWQEVQEQLSAGNADGAEQAVQLVLDQAAELEVHRMPAFAAALVAWAEANPGASGEAMVRSALRLDPEYPGTYFLEARWSRQRGAWMESIRHQLTGWISLFRYEPTRGPVVSWVILWIVFSLALILTAMMIAVVLRHLRSLAFDLRALGGELFRPANAWVFMVVVLLLPMFAGLGPMWLCVYLFALCWAYLGVPLRLWAVATCLLLMFLAPALAWMQGRLLQSQPMSARLTTVFEERQMDFAVLREMVDLEPSLAETSSYHLLLGELFRMHGEPGLARVQFQKALVADPGEVRALVFIGNLALEEGDAQRAVQIFNSALEIDANNPFIHHNLSLAFDLIRRFEEGDAARAKARAYSGPDSPDRGLRGLDPRIRFPRLGAADVARFEVNLDTLQEIQSGDAGSVVDRGNQVLDPVSLVFAAGLVVGLGSLAVRGRAFKPARECTKCGKTYRLQAGFGESTVYCPQCVSVFTKRDVVSIEQQTAKLQQIRNWERLTVLGRRLSGLLVPGSPYLFRGQVVRGVLFGLLTMFLISGALFWIPRFVPQIEPMAGYGHLQLFMVILAALMAVRSMTVAWVRR